MIINLKSYFNIIGCMLILIILNNCAGASTSLLGPAITASKSGNIYHAGLSYTSSKIIKEELGSSPAEYIKTILKKDSRKNRLK